MTRLRELTGVVAFGVIVVSIVGGEYLAAIVVSAVLLAVSIVAVARRSAGRSGGGVASTFDLAPAFALGWVMIGVLAAHQFTHRGAGTLNTPGIEGMWELFYFSATAALAIFAVRSVTDIGRTYVPVALLALPVVAVISALWSATMFYSIGRGLQLVSTGVFAWGTIVLGERDRAFLERMVSCTLRWIPVVVAGMTALGLTVGAAFAGASAENLETRFTWPGAHPNAAAFVAATAAVILVVTPKSLLRLSLWWRLALLAPAVYAVYATQARTSLLGLLAAAAFFVVTSARRSRFARYFAMPYVVLVGLIGSVVFQDELLGYFYRGQSSDEVGTGNGRIELWGVAFDLLRTPFDWMFGLGYAMSRSVFLSPERTWATNAHNSVLGVLVNLGLVGVVALVAWLGYSVIHMVRSGLHRDPLGGALMTLWVFCFVHGVAAETFSYPGTANSLMVFVTVVAVVRNRRAGAGLRPVDDQELGLADARWPPGRQREVSRRAASRSSGSSISTHAVDGAGTSR